MTAETSGITITKVEISSEYLLELADRALAEDIGSGDVTTRATVSPQLKGRGTIIAKQAGVISGLDIAGLIFLRLDAEASFDSELVEGARVGAGDVVAVVAGYLAPLLSAERIALNFLMHLSGIASLTSRYVEHVEGTSCRILDTRKTTPGLRLLEKRAVAAGGGCNHRIGLFDMVLIKDNHIAAAGSIATAVEAAMRAVADSRRADLEIEVETRTLADVREVLQFPVGRIMLDNFETEAAREAVKVIRDRNPDIEIEASGNINLDNVRDYAETGVDFLSVGALTHSAPCLDLTLRLQMQQG